eukprot:9067619-Pyramimonas_sp.AAC.1
MSGSSCARKREALIASTAWRMSEWESSRLWMLNISTAREAEEIATTCARPGMSTLCAVVGNTPLEPKRGGTNIATPPRI